MKVIHILGCSFAIVLSGSWASSQEKADELLGEWYTEDNESKVLVEKKGGKYYGTITWLSEPTYEPDDVEAGVIKHDRHNRDKSLRSRPILGITVLRGFVFNAKKGSWENGKIYDPENGKDYKCNIHIVSRGKGEEEQSLKLRGYIGFSALGRTTIWNRVPEDERKIST